MTKKTNRIPSFTARRIRELRERNHLQQTDVADFLGVKPSTVQRYESGEIQDIKYSTLCTLARVFDCNPVYFIVEECKTPGTYDSVIENSAVINGNNSSINVNTGSVNSSPTGQAAELLELFEKLDAKGRTMLMARAYELEERHCKKTETDEE